MPAPGTEDQLRTVCDDGVRKVPPIVRGKADNRHHTTGPDQIGELDEGPLGWDVMQGGDRHHGVERASFERNVEQVAMQPFHRNTGVACLCPFEDVSVDIEPNDAGNAGVNQVR